MTDRGRPIPKNQPEAEIHSILKDNPLSVSNDRLESRASL
jgi:hypothetical protein